MNFSTIPQLVRFIKASYDEKRILFYRENSRWLSITADQLWENVRHLTLGLHALLPRRSTCVGLIAQPSPLWLMVDMSIIIAGGITVPVFRRISPESLQFEIQDAPIHYMFIGLKDEYEFVRAHGKGIKTIFTMGIEENAENVVNFDRLIEKGKEICEAQPNLFDDLINRVQENDLATLIYTSGSTGIPRGVELTHKNLISQIKSASLRFPLDAAADRALSSLPLAHIFERMVMYFMVSSGISVYFVDDLANIGALIKDVKPTVMTVVPRLLEKVEAKMFARVSETAGFKGKLGKAAFLRALSREPGSRVGLKDLLFRKLVYKKLNQAMGGNLRLVISGAAPLPREIMRFFLNIGVPVYEGYGLTEASPVIAANYPGHRKAGTVGPLFPEVEVKIAEDGEILATSPGLMRCYHNLKELSETALAEGWLHTGDLGSLDDEGYLTITGRKKELFKKSTGEYVAPVPIEQALTRHEAVDMALIIGNGRKYVSCLIVPDFDNLEGYKNKFGFEGMTVGEFVKSPEFTREIGLLVKQVNSHLHHTEAIQKYTIMTAPFTVETGELTPTMKIRRHIVEKKYADLINSMYAEKNLWELRGT